MAICSEAIREGKTVISSIINDPKSSLKNPDHRVPAWVSTFRLPRATTRGSS